MWEGRGEREAVMVAKVVLQGGEATGKGREGEGNEPCCRRGGETSGSGRGGRGGREGRAGEGEGERGILPQGWDDVNERRWGGGEGRGREGGILQ